MGDYPLVNNMGSGYGAVRWPVTNTVGPSPGGAFGIPEDAYAYFLQMMGDEGKQLQNKLIEGINSGEINPDDSGTIIDRFLRLRQAAGKHGSPIANKLENVMGWNETGDPNDPALQMDAAGEERGPGFYTESMLPHQWYGK